MARLMIWKEKKLCLYMSHVSCDEIHNSFAYNKNVVKRQLLNIRTEFGIQINEI